MYEMQNTTIKQCIHGPTQMIENDQLTFFTKNVNDEFHYWYVYLLDSYGMESFIKFQASGKTY